MESEDGHSNYQRGRQGSHLTNKNDGNNPATSPNVPSLFAKQPTAGNAAKQGMTSGISPVTDGFAQGGSFMKRQGAAPFSSQNLKSNLDASSITGRDVSPGAKPRLAGGGGTQFTDESLFIHDQDDNNNILLQDDEGGDLDRDFNSDEFVIQRRKNNNFNQQRYIEINILKAGKTFGDLSLIGCKPRMASIRALEDTHCAVLSKQDFNIVLGQIEKKKLNEKIQFLRSLPFFSALTKTSVSKLTYQFKDMSLIKNQYLYREGEPAEYVYIVKNGQFEVTKTL